MARLQNEQVIILRFNERDIELIYCFLYAKNVNCRKISLEPKVLLDWCRCIHGQTIREKNFNAATYKSLMRLNSYGILVKEFDNTERRYNKDYPKFSLDKKRLIHLWRRTKEYEISKGILTIDGNVPKQLREKIEDEFAQGKFVIDTTKVF